MSPVAKEKKNNIPQQNLYSFTTIDRQDWHICSELLNEVLAVS